ncbi:hypothetical protein KQX54_016409 [Cotesia glomerata]|uniref:T-cell immunomodulatory protein TIP C2 domain-containing protein n=1 Tax=Cotesia glomerata TaxID=32391 RepID=A0AAV7ISU8_COTGL|nr:hypothetical protein KQX54_016409 [Cotesia glomerata]
MESWMLYWWNMKRLLDSTTLGLSKTAWTTIRTLLRKKKRTYDTNLPGPSIAYDSTTEEGYSQEAIAPQLPHFSKKSARFSLNLPYTTFELGHTSNSIERLTIGVTGKYSEWQQIIPNSQMMVSPTQYAKQANGKLNYS